MILTKNIWSIFYLILAIVIAYLANSVKSTWDEIEKSSFTEVSYINQIFAASVSSNFNQQEVTLDLLGQQMVENIDRTYGYQQGILDNLMELNSSIIGSAFANINGDIMVSSSNIKPGSIPNLKTNKHSSETFIEALEKNHLVLGKTYYLEPLGSWVTPMRKAIRQQSGGIDGVMIAGIKAEKLIPTLGEQQGNKLPYEAMLIKDDSFHYTYLSTVTNFDETSSILNKPVPPQVIDNHFQAILGQYPELDKESLKQHKTPVAYFAPGSFGEMRLYSMFYIPKYGQWSVVFTPRSLLIDQLIRTSTPYAIAAALALIFLFFLFRHIDQAERKNRNDLISQANHDFLTGLYNRQYLSIKESSWINSKQKPFAVLFIDLDNFKIVNDSYGHSYGDEILKMVADRINNQLPDGIICRQGGDEFIILTSETDQEKLEKLSRLLINDISRPYDIENFHFVIGASIGICSYPKDGKTFDELFSAADLAMYRAKEKKNQFFVFTPDLQEQTIYNAKIEQSLHTALGKEEFMLVYQPQINQDGSLYGVETLLRWHSDELGFVPPNHFIGLAESSGFIVPLGQYIIDKALKDISALSETVQNENFKLSINISVRQLQVQGFTNILFASLLQHQFPAHRLTLEITESIFIDDFEFILPVLEEIKSYGCHLSLDDFGTGYSSLSMLRNLPIDELKIDKSFIDQMLEDNQGRGMILNIINIAKNLEMLVVAEGIETEDQSKLLSEYGCHVQQGYLHSKPVSYDDLVEFYKNQ